MISRAGDLIRRFFSHSLFCSFYLPSLLFSIAWGIRTPVLPLYAHELSEGYGLVGLVVAGSGLGTLLADLPIGGLVRRMNKRNAMILGIAVDALSTLALFWVDVIWLAIVMRFFSGIGHALFSIARHTHITGAVHTASRGRAISLFGGVLRIGLFIGPAVGGLLAAHYGLRLPFVVYALLCVVTIVVIASARDDFKQDTADHLEKAVEGLRLRGVMKGRTQLFAIASIGHILAQIIRAGESLILPLWGSDMIGLSPDQIGWVVSFASAVSMTLFYPVGMIMDRLGRKYAIVPSFVIMGVGLGILPMTGNYTGLMLVAGLIGLGHGLGSGAMMTLGSDLSPVKGRSVYLSAWRWIGDAGSSGGPLIVGWVAEALALSFASLSIAAAGILAGMVFGFLVPETLHKKK